MTISGKLKTIGQQSQRFLLEADVGYGEFTVAQQRQIEGWI